MEPRPFRSGSIRLIPKTSVRNCRRALGFAVKWMYSVDSEFVLPWHDKLVSLMSSDEFRDMVDNNLLRCMYFIRKLGNTAAMPGAISFTSGKDLRQHP